MEDPSTLRLPILLRIDPVQVDVRFVPHHIQESFLRDVLEGGLELADLEFDESVGESVSVNSKEHINSCASKAYFAPRELPPRPQSQFESSFKSSHSQTEVRKPMMTRKGGLCCVHHMIVMG